MKKLFFIRHGLSEGNKANIWSGGGVNSPLAEEGRAQAKETAKMAKKLDIDLIVSSPMERARETAEIIAEGIKYPKEKILISDLLVERNFGDLEGLPHKDDDDSLDLDSVPNVETMKMILDRADKAIGYLEGLDADHILIVSHGSFGRALRHHLVEEMPFVNRKSTPENVLPNGEVIQWI